MTNETAGTSTGTRVNSNVVRTADGASLTCAHCHHELQGTGADYLSYLPRREGPVTDVGPQVFPDSAVFIDIEVVFRQYYCPGCFTAFHTEVVPGG